jgi:hypothetical protein
LKMGWMSGGSVTRVATFLPWMPGPEWARPRAAVPIGSACRCFRATRTAAFLRPQEGPRRGAPGPRAEASAQFHITAKMHFQAKLSEHRGLNPAGVMRLSAVGGVNHLDMI